MRLQRISLATATLLLSLLAPLPMALPLASLPAAAQAPDSRKAEGDRLNQQGVQQYKSSQFKAALQSWEQALKLYRSIQDGAGEGSALGHLGLAYHALGNPVKAIEYYEQSLAILRDAKNRQGQGAVLGNLGNAYESLRNYAKAIEYLEQSLMLARIIKNRRSEGSALGNLGNVYLSLGNYAKAIEYHEQSLAILQTIKDRQAEGTVLGNLGVAYESLRNYAKAIEYYEKRLAIAREIQDLPGESAALDKLGNAYNALRNYSKAIEYHKQSLVIARKLGDRQGESSTLGDLGIVYNTLGQYAKAIEYYKQSLAISWESKDLRGEGIISRNLGITYGSLGNYAKSIEYSERGLAIAREIQDLPGESAALGNLGNAYNALRNYSKAIEYYEQSLVIARKLGNRQGESLSLGNLGIVYYSRGQYAKAIAYYEQHLVIAREIQDLLGESAALGNLGVAYGELNQYAKAIDYQEQSLAIARKIQDRDGEGISLNNLGLARFRVGQLVAAEQTLQAGIEVWESIRQTSVQNDADKVSIFEEQARIYRTLQQVLVAQNKTNAALEIAERGRARAFVELVAQRLEQQEAGAKSQEIDPQPPTIQQIQHIAKDQNATLVQYSIIYEKFKDQGRPSTREGKLYIWVIQPTGEIAFRQVALAPGTSPSQTAQAAAQPGTRGPTSLDALVAQTQRALRGPTREGNPSRRSTLAFSPDPVLIQQQLGELYDRLIAPIADLLPTDPNDQVIFIPQGSLFFVPFPALIDNEGKYLIESHTIRTAPSIQVLQLTRQQRQQLSQQPLIAPGTNALIVGNPTPLPKNWESLPYAADEAKTLAQNLKAQPLLGAQATKSAVQQKMAAARLIHLAAHGQFDDQQGFGSLIVLAGTDPKTSYLTAAEIYGMDLQAELVVLSACQSGLGNLTGDGVIGLSRSFIAAGAPSVLVSLWNVPDDSTNLLMTRFYQQLQRNPDKAQALRQAMLSMTTRNPLDWAAFTLIGEAE